MVEQLIRNQQVAGSNPATSSKKEDMVKRPYPLFLICCTDLKSACNRAAISCQFAQVFQTVNNALRRKYGFINPATNPISRVIRSVALTGLRKPAGAKNKTDVSGGLV